MAVSKTILCIDDDPVVLALLKARLGAIDGYKIITASDGSSGLELAEKKRPDAILLDWMLPDGSGLGVLEALKGDSRTTWTPIYMLTGRTKMGDVERALEKGAAGYFTKPIKIVEISEHFAEHFKPAAGGILKFLKIS